MRCLLLSLALWIVGSASAKPRPPVVKKDPPAPPATLILCGPTNWGEFSQVGRQVAISGHASWTFAGEIRPDGRIQGVWALDGYEDVANAIYTIQADGSLYGWWGWGLEILPNGQLVGHASIEHIYREKKEPAPIR